MSIKKKLAGALSFAHLAGVGRAQSSDDDKPIDDDKEKQKAARAEDEDPEEEDDKKKDGAKAKDDETDAKAEDDDQPSSDDGDGDDKGDKKGRAKADEDDDRDDEMRGASAVAKARLREQARCAAIFASAGAAKNPVLAANLAFKTRMSRKEALVVLDSTPAAAPSHAHRSARNPALGAGDPPQQSQKQAQTARWDAAFAAVPGHRR